MDFFSKKQLAMRSFATFVAALMMTVAYAIPAKRGLIKTLTLNDGTQVEARLVGDEFGHYWLGTDGKAYQADQSGEKFMAVDAQQLLKQGAQRRASRDKHMRKHSTPNKVGEVGNYIGQRKGLIILVNYTDVSFKSSNNKALYERIANEKNFSSGNFVGSMYDYFYAQSDGQFELTFDIVGPVTVSKNMSYYGSNDYYGNDKYPATMVSEAVALADPQVNFADYDWDGDGYVDQIYVIYAGKGEADGGASNTIWPHQWELSEAKIYGDGNGAISVDGVKVDKYACGGELNGGTGNVAGIGTMCHEFSHCLGYPDFYDIDYSGGQGMGDWDLMCSGSYNGDGYRPAGYTSYERWQAGWKEPIVLKASKEVRNMKSLQEGGESYIIYNEGHRDEYFMLENRKKVSWDAGIPGEGLLILHVDYDASVWANNQPNDDPDHQRMTWIPADGEYQSYSYYGGSVSYSTVGMSTDPYPYGSNNAFNKSTNPPAEFYNQNYDGTYFLDSSVEEIKKNSDGSINFNFVGNHEVETPVFTPAAGIYEGSQQVTISCETEGATIYYTTDGTQPTASSMRYNGAVNISQTTTIAAIAIKEDKESAIARVRYIIAPADNNVKTYKKVASVDQLQSGKRYVIANESNSMAATALSGSRLGSSSVERYDDIIVVGESVEKFVLDITDDGYSFFNKDKQFIYASAVRNLAYGSEQKYWNVSNYSGGVVMAYDSYGTMYYNTSSRDFTTYTSTSYYNVSPAYLYEEYEMSDKLQPSIAFSQSEATGRVGELFSEPTLSVSPLSLAVSYSSADPNVATVNATTGKVIMKNAGTTVITATSAANDVYSSASASYTLTVREAKKNVEMSFDNNSIVAQIGEDFSEPVLTTNPEGIAVTYSSNKPSIAQVDAATGKLTLMQSGVATITASFSGNDEYNSAQTSYTLTVKAAKRDVQMQFSEENITIALGDDFSEPVLTTNPEGIAVVYAVDNQSVADIDASTGKLSINGLGTATVTASFGGNDEYNPAQASYTLTVVEPAIELREVVVDESGYTTLYYSNEALQVPEGVVARTYKFDSNSRLQISTTYNAADVIPAGEPVVIEALQGEYQFAVAMTETSPDNENVLNGTDVGGTLSEQGYTYYMLMIPAGCDATQVGFYQQAEGGQSLTIDAHKAYLRRISASAADHYLLHDDNPLNLKWSDNNATDGNTEVYTLDGHRINAANLQRGVYIVNGKKVVR